MEEMARSAAPVGGVYDQRALAARLGVPAGTLRSWRARGDQGIPEPAGYLSGPVWTSEQVEEMAARIKPRPGPGRPPTPATD